LAKYPDKMKELRKKTIELIPVLLKQRPLTIVHIFKKIQKKHKNLCDNTIICKCGKESSSIPEWKHQIRWAIQDLKFMKKITYDKEKKQYLLN